MDDLISRQEAIDDFTKWQYQLADCFGEDYSGVSIVESAIKSLEGYPSAQPEPLVIIHCKDCKHCATETDKDGTCYSCTLIYDAYTFWQDVDPTDFCSWAERKSDE